jgi:hypothetical protein
METKGLQSFDFTWTAPRPTVLTFAALTHMYKILNMRLLLLLFCVTLAFGALAQGTTTSEMRGIVTGPDGAPLIGANVVAVHTPTGTTFGTATDLEGNYQLPGLKVGGPYTVTVNYTGYEQMALEGISLRLGETFRKDFIMSEANITLGVVTVVGTSAVSGQTAGTSTQINAEKLLTVPSLNRDITDYLRLTPQANAYGDGLSLAGVNNRYNAIYIDGAVNNDVYGLATSGTNGGQTGISPFSIDIIDQFQVVLSPYDVSLGGFAGGGINAVTKSGTNQLSATAYYFFQNENLAGKTNGTLAERLGIADDDRTKLADFAKKTYGASIGGALKKDKIFFFTNVEIQDDVTPIPFETEQYTSTPGRASDADLESLRQFLINEYNYNPGGFASTQDELQGLKIFGKLDFNLGTKNRLTVRHQYTKAEQYDRISGSSTTINFDNNGVYFPSTTNSSAAELQTRFGQSASNELILGYTTVTDDRDGIGTDFPFLLINDVSGGTIRLGTDEFSTANLLDQSTFTLTDNFKLYKGNHTFTFGTHNEFYSFNNIFIGQNFGTYRFASIADFMNGVNAIEYDRSYSLVDDASGDETKAAADFNAMQLGVYLQDQWTLNSKFTLTGGIRLDVPVITTDPVEDTNFNEVALPKMQAAYEVAKDVVAGKAPDGQLMFSPRIGFEYDMDGDRTTILRGGVGIFTSRIPFVWPGAMFTNNGLTVGRVDETNLGGSVVFSPDVNAQYTNPNFAVPSGQVDVFTKDFKYPQVFKTNLALDHKFGNGWQTSFEVLYTKTLNNIVYTNINSDPAVKFNWTLPDSNLTAIDDRPVYFRRSLDNTYSAGVYAASNTSEGHTINMTASLTKQFGESFSAYVAYNYGDAFAVQEGTSSQNSSQWRGQTNTDGRNVPLRGRSDFAIGHRILANLTYQQKWSKGIATSVSLFYNGESGEAFSYVIGGSGGSVTNINNETGSTSRNRSLIYVPRDLSEINLKEYTAGGVTVTVDEQWANLNAMIESDPGLSSKRGSYVEKNGSFAPFNHVFDLVIRQDLGADLGGDMHKIQLSFDIFNVANLLNKNWGAFYATPGSDFNNFQLYQFDGYEADGTSPKFSYRLGDATGKDIFNISGTSSRWRMRIGVRYMFN